MVQGGGLLSSGQRTERREGKHAIYLRIHSVIQRAYSVIPHSRVCRGLRYSPWPWCAQSSEKPQRLRKHQDCRDKSPGCRNVGGHFGRKQSLPRLDAVKTGSKSESWVGTAGTRLAGPEQQPTAVNTVRTLLVRCPQLPVLPLMPFGLG